ncbi:MAG: adenosylcobalamin-dependent ribonucleoside-diphosphate reductase [Natronomonas sp.]|jgi:adenosylcobalamin-dependent ribonucleoside-diphosphate reductase|uniref:adenosylcobalamin-dependent ribonucleoside-diphosphate reductase n=1 Tax=Natronomonas sp. TaxID=2184060 RepID=UPI0039899C5E
MELPAKRTTGETVAERLPEVAAERVLPARYLKQDATGEVTETPSELFERVAHSVARAEGEHDGDPSTWEGRYHEMLTNLAFLPNSPTLMNAGTSLGQLAACFVMSPDDDLGDIFRTIRRAARIFQSGGGVGYSFSRLRPRGDPVAETGGVAGGPVSFMQVFDSMCEAVKQGGKRRGAQMAVLRVDHPDVGRFCVAKRDLRELTNFNLSVGITDEFMAAVDADEPFELTNPRTGDVHHANEATARFYNASYADAHESAVPENLWRDYDDDVAGIEEYRGDLVEVDEPMALPAGLIWRLLVDGAWRSGDPGLFHIDAANRDTSFDIDEYPRHRILATNPCGEQPLEEFEACNLGHVNLSVLALDDRPLWPDFEAGTNENGESGDAAADLEARMEAYLDVAIDLERLDRLVCWGIRFLDDVITVSEYPLERIDSVVKRTRKVGLGVMGFAELCCQFGIQYGSDASIEFADQLMARIDRVATTASHDLAEERGSFPDWSESKYAAPTDSPEWFRQHTKRDPEEHADGFPMRNHGVTSIAPTGTTSIIAGTSGGCEPLYDVVYLRNVSRDVEPERLVHVDDYFERTLEANDIDVTEVKETAAELLTEGEYGGPHDLPIPEEMADLFVRAHEVTPDAHVRVQAAFQNHVDGAVSKTINLPSDADRESVANAYRLAVERGCKGVTVYRAGAREGQVLSAGDDDGENCE